MPYLSSYPSLPPPPHFFIRSYSQFPMSSPVIMEYKFQTSQSLHLISFPNTSNCILHEVKKKQHIIHLPIDQKHSPLVHIPPNRPRSSKGTWTNPFAFELFWIKSLSPKYLALESYLCEQIRLGSLK